jgi:hypothetical protein
MMGCRMGIRQDFLKGGACVVAIACPAALSALLLGATAISLYTTPRLIRPGPVRIRSALRSPASMAGPAVPFPATAIPRLSRGQRSFGMTRH